MVGKDFENPFNQKFKKVVKINVNITKFSSFPGSQGGPLEHVIAGKGCSIQRST